VSNHRIPELAEIVRALGTSQDDVSAQLYILEALGVIEANRTLGSVVPVLIGKGGKFQLILPRRSTTASH
jgi:hypothetical protein